MLLERAHGRVKRVRRHWQTGAPCVRRVERERGLEEVESVRAHGRVDEHYLRAQGDELRTAVRALKLKRLSGGASVPDQPHVHGAGRGGRVQYAVHVRALDAVG